MDYITPVVPCHGMEDENKIYIKRDDLLPFSFGGNKARIAEEFFKDMEKQHKNCMIGYGNARSNLCRAIANMSYAKYEGKGFCHIISPDDEDGTRTETSNSLIVQSCGVVQHTCKKNQVAETVSAVMKACEEQQLRPYYIYGDETGHGNEAVPVHAYAKVYEEIKNQYDYIFLATGTGMTQAGLLAGKLRHAGSEKIVGISIARSEESNISHLTDYLHAYLGENQEIDSKDIMVTDEYLCGGYGKYSAEILDTIRRMQLLNGIPMDPTYTGKGFYGMLQYLKKHKIVGKKILFIHTGGTPLFFDNEARIFDKPFSLQQLYDFVEKIDKHLPVTLSERVDLKEYVKKIYNYGHIKVVMVNGAIVSLIAGYTENLPDDMSYLTLIGTLPEHSGHGYAKKVMAAYEEDCKELGIKGIHLHTAVNNIPARQLYKEMGYVDYKVENEPWPKSCHLAKWLS